MNYAAIPMSGALMLIGGCASQHAPALTSIESTPAEPVITVASAEPVHASTMWAQVLSELIVAYEASEPTNAFATQEQMPQLVAGDWLAIQCAMAGGYWDAPNKNDAPAFAEAPESWYPLD